MAEAPVSRGEELAVLPPAELVQAVREIANLRAVIAHLEGATVKGEVAPETGAMPTAEQVGRAERRTTLRILTLVNAYLEAHGVSTVRLSRLVSGLLDLQEGRPPPSLLSATAKAGRPGEARSNQVKGMIAAIAHYRRRAFGETRIAAATWTASNLGQPLTRMLDAPRPTTINGWITRTDKSRGDNPMSVRRLEMTAMLDANSPDERKLMEILRTLHVLMIPKGD